MTPPPSSIPEDLLRAAVTPLDGLVDADVLALAAAHEATWREHSPGVTRLVTRVVGAEHAIAYEWREVDAYGDVVRKAATVIASRDAGSPRVNDFGAVT